MLTVTFNRVNTLLLVLLVLMAGSIIAILATRASGGPLDPPGAPAPSMQTLDNIPGSWSRQLTSTNGNGAGCGSDRFECVFPTLSSCLPFCFFIFPAVLDHETGLVWQRTPGNGTGAWATAYNVCGQATTGNRQGWRLPTREEMQSLEDPTNASQLPTGNPFANVSGSDEYWTSTTFPDSPGTAYAVLMGSAGAGTLPKSDPHLWWCVRGAGGFDGR